MIKNYLKIAWRNMRKHKTHTGINILGMMIAFGTSIVLFFSVYQDLSYDDFHRYKDRVYELYNFENRTAGEDLSNTMGYPVVTHLKEEGLGIDKATRIKNSGGEIRYGDKTLDLNMRLVDNDFFEIFTFPVVMGQKQGPLRDLDDLVINQETAKSLFGKQDPIGKTAEVKFEGEWKALRVSAVMRDAPPNSSFKFAALARTELDPGWVVNKDKWNSRDHNVFVRLSPQADQGQAERQLRGFVQKYQHPDIAKLKNDGYVADRNGDYLGMKLLPLAEYHFNGQLGAGSAVSKSSLYILLLIAAVIISIACFNFINLQISLSFTRNKELGVRKYLGAGGRQIWGQLFSENFLQVAIALLLGLGGATLLIRALTQQNLVKGSMASLFSPAMLAILLLILFIVSFVSSGYPYLVMNKLKTVEIFKGKTNIRSGMGRNVLITLQFVIAIVLICTTAITYLQFQYLRKAPLGYTTSSLISIPVKDYLHGRDISAKLRTQLVSQPAIVSVSGGDVNLGLGTDGSTSKSQIGFDFEGRNVSTTYMGADYDFLKTLSIKPLEGRDFSSAYLSDSADAVIITESMAKQLGKSGNVGSVVNPDSAGSGWHIIAVIPDFHLYSLHEKTAPLTISLHKDAAISYIFVRVNTANPVATMDLLKKVYAGLEPGVEFRGSYVDENVDRWYKKEQRQSTIFSVAASIAIVLSCMGLFGLALIIIAQRVKEIGIRKVLGATVTNISTLVIRDFIKPVLVAIVIGIPIAWWAMNEWLQDFVYRMDMPWWVFPITGVAAIWIAVLTVSFQTIRAAVANPVESLRDE